MPFCYASANCELPQSTAFLPRSVKTTLIEISPKHEDTALRLPFQGPAKLKEMESPGAHISTPRARYYGKYNIPRAR